MFYLIFNDYTDYFVTSTTKAQILAEADEAVYQYMSDHIDFFDCLNYQAIIEAINIFAFERKEDGSLVSVEIPYRKIINRYVDETLEWRQQDRYNEAKRKFFKELEQYLETESPNLEEFAQKWKDEIQPLSPSQNVLNV